MKSATIDFDKIPTELRELDHWVCWKYEERTNKAGERKITKPPFKTDGRYASSTNPETWSTFDKVCRAHATGSFEGVGFVLSSDDGFAGVDLDNAVDENGAIHPEALEIVRSINSYTEVSPSGRGLRIFSRATLNDRGRKKDLPAFGVEVYDKERYLTCTGQHVESSPSTIESRQAEIEALIERVFGDRRARQQAAIDKVFASNPSLGTSATDKEAEAPKSLFELRKWAEAELDAQANDRSTRDYRVVACLIERGLEDNTIHDIVKGRSKFAERNGDYFTSTIANARAKVKVGDKTALPRPTVPAAYILVPGSHTDDKGEYIEVGSDDFAAEVLKRFPDGALYRRDRIVGEVIGTAGKRRFSPVTPDRMRMIVDQHMRLGKWASLGENQFLSFKPCSRDWASLVITGAEFCPDIPDLLSIVHYPTFTIAWEMSRPGFHDGIYYDEPTELADLHPEADPQIIIDVLNDLVVDFPFKDEADCQNYFGLTLTPIIRTAINGNVPFHAIIASMERTGKTKLGADVMGELFSGASLDVTSLPSSEEELDKRILSLLIKGENFAVLDNIKAAVNSGCLAALATAKTYTGRLLGVSQMPTVPNNLTVILTANNLTASGEIAKRSIPIVLESRTPEPELRSDFQHPNLTEFLKSMRRRILECLIGAVLHWRATGGVRSVKRLGGFDEWAGVVGGILESIGFDQWRQNERLWRRAADPDGEDLGELVGAWADRFQRSETASKDLADLAKSKELFPEVFTGKTDQGSTVAFTKRVLRANVNRPVGEWIIRRKDFGSGSRWHLDHNL